MVVASNVMRLGEWRGKEEIRLVNTVPSAMAELVRMKGIPDSVRVVNLAGEALSGSLVRAIYEQKTVERVVNLYGPTEDTTYSTYMNLKRERGRGAPRDAAQRHRRGWLV